MSDQGPRHNGTEPSYCYRDNKLAEEAHGPFDQPQEALEHASRRLGPGSTVLLGECDWPDPGRYILDTGHASIFTVGDDLEEATAADYPADREIYQRRTPSGAAERELIDSMVDWARKHFRPTWFRTKNEKEVEVPCLRAATCGRCAIHALIEGTRRLYDGDLKGAMERFRMADAAAKKAGE